MRTIWKGSSAESTGPEYQWVLWEILNRAPLETQREDKQFLTQVLHTCILKIPSRVDMWRYNKDAAKAAKTVNF